MLLIKKYRRDIVSEAYGLVGYRVDATPIALDLNKYFIASLYESPEKSPATMNSLCDTLGNNTVMDEGWPSIGNLMFKRYP